MFYIEFVLYKSKIIRILIDLNVYKFKSLILLFSDAKWIEQESTKIINILGILFNEMLRHKLLKHNNDNLRDSFY